MDLIIYPYFDGPNITVDLYKTFADEEPLGGAEFSLEHLVEEAKSQLAADDGKVHDDEAIEGLYKTIDALREAANQLAELIDDPEEDAA